MTKLASAYHDAALGTVALTAIFDEGLPGRRRSAGCAQDRLRLVGADELRVLAEDAGLVVEVLAGDYDLAPIGAGDERAILVAQGPPPVLSGGRSADRAWYSRPR